MRNFSVAAHDPLSSLSGHALQSLTPEVHAASYDTYGGCTRSADPMP
jgi:hypothetical protein